MRRLLSKCLEFALLTVFLTASVAVVSLTEAASKGLTCKQLYKIDVNKPQHMAMATTGGRPMWAANISCGGAWGYPTKKSAEVEAIRRCNGDKNKRKTPGVCTVTMSK